MTHGKRMPGISSKGKAYLDKSFYKKHGSYPADNQHMDLRY